VPAALVTGATGQDGGYLVERLMAEGYSVHVVVSNQDEIASQQSILGDRGIAHVGDLRDRSSLAAAISACEPDEVYNLGGISSVAFSWENPELTIEVSGLGVVRLMESLREWARTSGRSPRIVQASSAEIFGSPAAAPQNESTPIQPVSPYGAAKALAHQMVGVYRTTGLHASTAILYNHESPRRPSRFVTRKITEAAARISRGLQDSLALGAMDVRRDWGWAPDYVDAIVRIGRAAEPGDFVVATGESHSIADFVAAAFARVGILDWARYVHTDAAFVRPSDPGELVGDSSLLRSTLGWSPTASFNDVVDRMVDADLALLGSDE
jgi:GDPmannose 4,6-dehydratase